MLFDKLEMHSSKVALISENFETLNFHDLTLMTDKICKNIKKRSLIFLFTENSIDSIVGYISFIKSNCVVMLIDPKTKNNEFDLLFQRYSPDFLWCNKKTSIKAQKDFFSIAFSLNDFHLLKNKNKISYEIDDHLMLLISTSGSLGDPKCVKLSYKNISQNSLAISKYLKINSNDRAITTLPMSYSYGLSIINTHLNSGASIVLTSKTLLDKLFWKLFVNLKVNNFNGVPFTFEITKKIGFSKIFNENVRYITQAGGRMNNKNIEEITEKSLKTNIKFYVMYGQTEASPRMSYLDMNLWPNKIGSIGMPIPGGNFWLENDKGKKIEKSNELGELIYSGDNVCMGYSNNFKDLNIKDTNQGKLNTGDVAKKDNDGFYFIIGRKKRMIKLYGERISLDYIEEKLKERNYNVACEGNDDQLFIFFEKKNNTDIDINEISKIINIIPSRLNLKQLEDFPKNESGKILYKNLKKVISNE
tara:strand:- start:2407 stop:3828 length:1422 start_codon:yes stop_codon:yes gene_type:complete